MLDIPQTIVLPTNKFSKFLWCLKFMKAETIHDNIGSSWRDNHAIIKTFRSIQNGQHLADDISKFVFLYGNCIFISLNFVPKCPVSQYSLK